MRRRACQPTLTTLPLWPFCHPRRTGADGLADLVVRHEKRLAMWEEKHGVTFGGGRRSKRDEPRQTADGAHLHLGLVEPRLQRLSLVPTGCLLHRVARAQGGCLAF